MGKRESTNKGNYKHGHKRVGKESRTYKSWSCMMYRCYNPASNRYHMYGERGVKVYFLWHKFENFLKDMGERPEGMTLDRYPDNYGNYEPGNCRWATRGQQASNTRNVTRARTIRCYAGPKGVKTIREWSLIAGVPRTTVCSRLRYGWEPKEAVFGIDAENMNEAGTEGGETRME